MNLVPAPLVGLGPERLSAGIRPEHVRLGVGELEGTVEVVEYLGDEQVVHIRFHDAELLAKTSAEQRLEAGQPILFSVSPPEPLFFDAGSGERVGDTA
jgi:ABC-type sugar transport system ATPase subunit